MAQTLHEYRLRFTLSRKGHGKLMKLFKQVDFVTVQKAQPDKTELVTHFFESISTKPIEHNILSSSNFLNLPSNSIMMSKLKNLVQSKNISLKWL